MNTTGNLNALTRAILEADNLDDLLDLAVTSEWSIPSTSGAILISAETDEKPKVLRAKYLPSEISSKEWEAEDLVDLARLSKPTHCETGFSPITDSLISDFENVTSAVCAPLRMRGRLYGVLVLCNKNAAVASDAPDWEFFVHTLGLAISKLLQDGSGTKAARLSQSQARLSDRQIEIADLVIRGQSNQDIANNLHLSLGTVKVELGKIFRKLGIAARSEVYLPGE